MARSPADDDAQRALEQQALRNVRSLAERLGYRDLLDQRAEKIIVIAIAATVAVILAVLGLRVAMTPSRTELETELARCQLDIRVREAWQLRHELRKAQPDIGNEQLDRKVNERYNATQPAARAECTAKLGKAR